MRIVAEAGAIALGSRAKTIELTGNSNVSADCEAEIGAREMNAGRKISLVR
jgi:hypothetical protein